jgi:hypothetical protein
LKSVFASSAELYRLSSDAASIFGGQRQQPEDDEEDLFELHIPDVMVLFHTTTSRAIADGRTAAYKTTPRENEMSPALPRPTPQQQQVQVQEQSVAGILAPHQTSSGAPRGSLVERQREALRQHCLRMMGGKSWPSGNSATLTCKAEPKQQQH